MKILFICKFNRFRSQVAEGLFKKINKNKKHKAKSAGLIRGTPLSKVVIDSAKDFDVELKHKPKGLTSDMLKWSDTQINVADDVPRGILKDSKKYGKKLEVWMIPDTDSNNKKDNIKIIKMIEKKIINLVGRLK